MTHEEIVTRLVEVSKGGKIFSVKFRKRTDNTIRHMTCRTRVTKGLVGGDLPYSREEKNLFGVFDMETYNRLLRNNNDVDAAKLSYRNIPIESITEINGVMVSQSETGGL